MTFNYHCPTCGCEYAIDPDAAEDTVVCPECDAELNATLLAVFKRRRVGGYAIIKHLGGGGMGEVFLANQESMGRRVALKILHPCLAKNPGYLKRFTREVKILASIEHPNVIQAIEAGDEEGIHYFSMTYSSGEDLRLKLLNEGKLEEREGLAIIRDVALALKNVWEKRRLIHRDIKPANIMVDDDGRVKLMDMGISKRVTEDSNLTVTGMMVGSPNYISPEQARASADVDFRADMYSLGATFFHLITGQPPYHSGSSMTIIASHLRDPVPDPRVENPAVSGVSAALIETMMAKDRDERFASWDEALASIQETLNELGGGAAARGKRRRGAGSFPLWRWSKSLNDFLATRGARLTALLFLLVVSLSFFGWVLKKSLGDQRRKRAAAAYQLGKRALAEDNEEARGKAVAHFKKVLRIGDQRYSALAKKEIETIVNGLKAERKRREAESRRNALNKLKRASFKLEEELKFAEAIELWRKYLREGSYREEFKEDAMKEINYLRRQREKKRKGLLYER